MIRTGKCLVLLAIATGIIYISSTQAAPKEHPKKYTETVTSKNGDKISFDMVLIPSGDFVMGSPAGEADRLKNETPQHKVKLDSFYLCTTETTIALYRAFYQETVTANGRSVRFVNNPSASP